MTLTAQIQTHVMTLLQVHLQGEYATCTSTCICASIVILYLSIYSITVMASDEDDNLFYLSKLGKCAHIVAPVMHCACKYYFITFICTCLSFFLNLYVGTGS